VTHFEIKNCATNDQSFAIGLFILAPVK